MLDINLIRNKTEEVRSALLKRLAAKDFDLEKVIKFDDQRKDLLKKVEQFKAERNKFSKTKPDAEMIKQMKKVGEEITKLDEQISQVEAELKENLSALPNLPAPEVPAGDKRHNQVLAAFNKKPDFKFKAKNHVELATNLGLIDYERGAKMAGSGFWVYQGQGAILEWALLNYFIDFHRQNNYTFLIPPFLLTEESAYASGHLPKFRNDLYWTEDGLCLDATAEMMILNFHRAEILAEKDLPKKYFAYSACFRREAGSYRTEERGMVRGHQFNKIEMFQFTLPANSRPAFDELVNAAVKLAQGLGLHFRTVLLAAADASAAMSKTVDIEVYIPSMGGYKEISSVSNALDYQARRANVRFKNQKTGKNEFVHTLNGSGLATSRLVPAILEQFQQKDGSIEIPKALRKYCGFKRILK